MNAASALAINTVVRSTFGAGFPLFAAQMYNKLVSPTMWKRNVFRGTKCCFKGYTGSFKLIGWTGTRFCASTVPSVQVWQAR